METYRKLCVFVVLLTFVAANESFEYDELKHRLALIETTLERILQKNDQLQAKNNELKATVEVLQYQIQEIHKREKDKEHIATDNDSVIYPSEVHQNKIVASEIVAANPKRQLHVVARTIAFTAVVSQAALINLGQGQTIIYDKIITNVGGAYHNTTGIFTAPYSGVYVFNFALMVDADTREFLQLVKNGNQVMYNYGHGIGSDHYVSASRTATIELTAGDEVWVRTPPNANHGTGYIHGHEFTTFSGWVIDYSE